MARALKVRHKGWEKTKRKAYMEVILSIYEHNNWKTISLTKKKITDMMRAITDYCENDNYLYQNPKRSQITYKYSKDAWALKDNKNNKGLVGDHCVPLNAIFNYLEQVKMGYSFQRAEIEKFLEYHLEVVMITKEEHKILSDNGLKKDMPPSWKFFGDKFARYNHSGISIALESAQNSIRTPTK